METYVVVAENELFDLEETVNRFLGKGYTPLGGVSITVRHNSNDIIFTQAMIKVDKKNTLIINDNNLNLCLRRVY